MKRNNAQHELEVMLEAARKLKKKMKKMKKYIRNALEGVK